MCIEWLDALHTVDIILGSFSNFSLCLPEILVFGQLAGIDSHLDDLTVCLELFEDVQVNVSPIVNIAEVLVHLLDFPLAKKDSVFQDGLGRHFVKLLLDRSPLSLG